MWSWKLACGTGVKDDIGCSGLRGACFGEGGEANIHGCLLESWTPFPLSETWSRSPQPINKPAIQETHADVGGPNLTVIMCLGDGAGISGAGHEVGLSVTLRHSTAASQEQGIKHRSSDKAPGL